MAGAIGTNNRPLRRRAQLAEEVAVHIRNMIMSGEVRPGEFVRLEQVATTLAVSVTPVREALATLRGEDLVELVPHRGYLVAPLSRQDVEDTFDLQAELAGKLAARAAVRRTTADLVKLDEIQTELTSAAAAPIVEAVETLEFEFHRTINRIADSRKLAWFLRTATRYLPQHFYSTDPAWRSAMVDDHLAILAALRDRDADQASAAMSRHVTEGGKRLVAHLSATNMWGNES
jgi:DNA-binding GntR family transcriptional regulator